MTYKEIVDLIKLINKTELTEINIKDGDFKLCIRNKDFSDPVAISPEYTSTPIAYQPVTAPAPVVPQVESIAKKEAESGIPVPDLKPVEDTKENGNLIEVKSPIVGTFYRSSSPDKGPFIKVGDTIEPGQVVCIVEAMKLFNEIESEVSGKVVKVMVEDASPVEYDQVLFLVDPS